MTRSTTLPHRCHAFLPCAILLSLLAMGFCSSSTRADSCIGASAVPGRSADGRYTVHADFDRKANQWSYTWIDTQTNRMVSKAMPAIPSHSHLYLFVSNDGSRFAALRATGGREFDRRLLIYQRDGKLVKAFDIKDLLNEQEIGDVQRSVSHIQWLYYDGKTRSMGKVDAKSDVLEMKSRQGRLIRVSLPKAKVAKR